jgi:Tfp pilus assembly protein PilF
MAAMDAPHNANYSHNLGVAMLKQGQPAEAEQLFRHTLEIDPMHQPAYHSLASLLKEQNRHGEAQEMLITWAETQPYLAEPHVELAWMNRETGNHAQAEEHLRQALKVEPSNATALAHLGQVYDDQGRSSEAVAMYRRSLYQDWNQHDVKGRVATLTGQRTRHPYPSGASVAAPRYSAAPAYGTPQFAALPPTPQFAQPQFAAQQTWTPTQPTPVIASAPQQSGQVITLLPPIPEDPYRQELQWGEPQSPPPLMVTPDADQAHGAQPDQRLSFATPLVEAH